MTQLKRPFAAEQRLNQNECHAWSSYSRFAIIVKLGFATSNCLHFAKVLKFLPVIEVPTTHELIIMVYARTHSRMHGLHAHMQTHTRARTIFFSMHEF